MAQSKTILLLTGDYPDRLNALFSAAKAAKDDEDDGVPRLLHEDDPYTTLATEYAELKAEAEKHGVRVELRAIGRREWRALKVAHPPRTEGDDETVKGDRLAGVNTETVEDDLVHAALTFPEFTSRAAFDEWADTLSEGEFQTVLQAAWRLVNVAQYDPKSLPVSQTRTLGAST